MCYSMVLFGKTWYFLVQFGTLGYIRLPYSIYALKTKRYIDLSFVWLKWVSYEGEALSINSVSSLFISSPVKSPELSQYPGFWSFCVRNIFLPHPPFSFNYPSITSKHNLMLVHIFSSNLSNQSSGGEISLDLCSTDSIGTS